MRKDVLLTLLLPGGFEGKISSHPFDFNIMKFTSLLLNLVE